MVTFKALSVEIKTAFPLNPWIYQIAPIDFLLRVLVLTCRKALPFFYKSFPLFWQAGLIYSAKIAHCSFGHPVSF